MNVEQSKSCNRCGKCCLKSPCSIPAMHVNALKVLLTKEFNKPESVNNVDIVNILFRYKEEILEDGRIHGYFMPLSGRSERCMWLEKNNGKYSCKLFWNKTADCYIEITEHVGDE